MPSVMAMKTRNMIRGVDMAYFSFGFRGPAWPMMFFGHLIELPAWRR